MVSISQFGDVVFVEMVLGSFLNMIAWESFLKHWSIEVLEFIIGKSAKMGEMGYVKILYGRTGVPIMILPSIFSDEWFVNSWIMPCMISDLLTKIFDHCFVFQ